jgi:hypothetical protein
MDDRIAEHKNARRESRLKLYPILTEFYEQFLYLKAHEEEQDKFLGRCIREGVTIEAGARPRRNPCPARAETISRGNEQIRERSSGSGFAGCSSGAVRKNASQERDRGNGEKICRSP